jgi:hypothetical protein
MPFKRPISEPIKTNINPKIDKESPTKRKKELPFKVKKYLTRNMSGCYKSTGYTSKEIYEMLGWE